MQLEVNDQARVDFHLAVEGQKAQVTISATESLVPTESSDLGTVIDQSRVQGRPLNQRDFLQLALLTPGVAPPIEGSQLSTTGGFAMDTNGGMEEFNNFLWTVWTTTTNIFSTERGGNSNFNSLQVSLNRRLARGLTFLAIYTFSKSIDATAAFLADTGDLNFPQDSHNYRPDRGLSSFDMTHRAVIRTCL